MASLRIRDLPSFCFVNDASDYMLNFAMTEAQSCRQASALILNTFDESEQPIMEALSNELSVYSIGPLLLSESDGEVKTRNLLLGSSLWKEETGCLQWLDTQQPGSVIYVCFGSITMLSSKQVAEFAWGLESSKQPFLWAIRPDLVHGESAILPNEFIEETRSRGMFVSWAPQIKVLSHPSVGGFLTHCGWNSTLESICYGVPMICWPFFAEQQINKKFICDEWKIGLEMKDSVEREEVERLVKSLMSGEESEQMRKRIGVLKESASRSVKKGGSSYNNLDKLLDELLQTRSLDFTLQNGAKID